MQQGKLLVVRCRLTALDGEMREVVCELAFEGREPLIKRAYLAPTLGDKVMSPKDEVSMTRLAQVFGVDGVSKLATACVEAAAKATERPYADA